ncbi:hypothetical protein AB685_27995, partial [Bacillus sp. LL01]|uniref:hypothetical protein n=1 Tax=Bacillus sp. LL01 TaxID=1665556 RepID=UPI00064CF03E
MEPEAGGIWADVEAKVMITTAEIRGENPLDTNISYDTRPTAVSVPVDVRGPAIAVMPSPNNKTVSQPGVLA